MPTDTKKEFDSVQMMRELRDRISRDIEGMTFEQEKAYIRERLKQARQGHPPDAREHAAGG
jgi:type II secretory pathway predicted ATPase ExeA